RYSHTDPMLGGSVSRGCWSGIGCSKPVYDGRQLWQPALWLSERTTAALCIQRAVRGRGSQTWMPGAVGGDGLKSPRDPARGGVGLEVEHVLRRGAAEQVEEDDALGLAGAVVAGPGLFLGPQQARQREEAAQQRQGAGLERLAAGQAVATAARAAQHRDHRTSPQMAML